MKTSRAEEAKDSSGRETLKRAAEIFDSSVLGAQLPPVRSSSGSREQQPTQKSESWKGKPLAEGANLFDAVAAFATSQDPLLAGKSGKSSAGHKASAAGPHRNPFIGVQKLVMPEGHKPQAPLSARSLKQDGDHSFSRKPVRADKLASKQPQAQEGNLDQPVNPFTAASGRFVHKSSTKNPWSSMASGTSTERVGRNPRSVDPPSDSQQDQQQNAFQIPRQPPWTRYRGNTDQAPAFPSAFGLRQDGAGDSCCNHVLVVQFLLPLTGVRCNDL